MALPEGMWISQTREGEKRTGYIMLGESRLCTVTVPVEDYTEAELNDWLERLAWQGYAGRDDLPKS